MGQAQSAEGASLRSGRPNRRRRSHGDQTLRSAANQLSDHTPSDGSGGDQQTSSDALTPRRSSRFNMRRFRSERNISSASREEFHNSINIEQLQQQNRAQENSALFMEEPPSLLSMDEPPSEEFNRHNNPSLGSFDGNSSSNQNLYYMPDSITNTTSQQQHHSSSVAQYRANNTSDSSLRTPGPNEYRRSSVCSVETGSSVSDFEEEQEDPYSNFEFYPQASRDNEWMGRSIESLVLGHISRAPILQLLEDEENDDATSDFYAFRRRSTASTFGGGGRRRSSQGSFPGGRRGSLSLSGGTNYHGGTLANYYSRRRQVPTDVDRSFNERQGRRGSTSHTPMYRRRSSITMGTSSAANNNDQQEKPASAKGGPNIAFSVLAREYTGKSCFPRGIPSTQCLRSMGGHALYNALDQPAAGMATEVAFLAAAIDTGDWTETQAIVSRLAPRLVGDPMATVNGGDRAAVQDPNLPPTAPRFYAGGGRTGLERDAFVQAGGVDVLIRVFREKSFVGQEMAFSYDARDLSPEIVATRLAPCWNEALVSLRELVYSIPALVEDRKISDNGEFLPFLFTLLSHDSCFDSAAHLIEEILALLSQSPHLQPTSDVDGVGNSPTFQPVGRLSPPTTFFLGNVPDLYKLWAGFNCRQLAHFCRILALLIFEPEDRQLLESPAVLKSLELLLLRRNRAVRAGRDSSVDMNQSILLGDEQLLSRLLQLLRVMNFAPSLRRVEPFHVLAQFPFIGDTLVMLGLNELDQWSEIDRQEQLARKMYLYDKESDAPPTDKLLGELGSVADMLEGLAETLSEPSNQIGHIIHVISAAQQAGVIVGRNDRRSGSNQRNGRSGRAPTAEDQETAAAALRLGGVPVDNATIQGLASVAGILTDQNLVRRLHQGSGDDSESALGGALFEEDGMAVSRHLINTPEDAANSMQFNGMLLGPYQVEVLFVLCTLLGGRRKLDAQDSLKKLGLVPVLHDMFQRLPWYKKEGAGDDENSPSQEQDPESQSGGIHGPGCECTPESALCVQYLRLLHNFCDRDCDNYTGRRLLLSESERNFIFRGGPYPDIPGKHGLLSKIMKAFIAESDDSPYRFWLASCIESYLRGSSPDEQMFAAQSGLMAHLIEDVSSDRLHCAGSLQTSFDLLGELGKGNSDVVRLLVNDLGEESFRKLMSVAAANLVDSNVFIRSLLLSLERLAASERFVPLYSEAGPQDLRRERWYGQTGVAARSYLTHSWWDAHASRLIEPRKEKSAEDLRDEARPADWFPVLEIDNGARPQRKIPVLPSGLQESVGHFGWVFTPAGESLCSNTYLPNTVERLSWFLAANQARLLRDLLGVVDLRNINHENICCLNTAVVIAIFAHRRRQLPALLEALRQLNDEEKDAKRRALDAARHDDVVDRAFVQAMRYLDLDNQRDTPTYARRRSLTSITSTSGAQQIGDRADVMRNFREVLWFWTEYYTHRGRDRLSLEFSSHIRFQEWNHVVSLLAADDGSATSLIRHPLRLPRSPYQRAARIADSPVRGV